MIAPVFSYSWQRWVFFGTLAGVMALPFVPKPAWMDRGILYRSYIYNVNTHNNIVDDVLREKGDIDILFLGSSSIGSSVNPVRVRGALRALTGKESTVYTVYHPNAGLDLDYIMLKDILAKRKVKLLVWDALRLPIQGSKTYHKASSFLWDMSLHGEEVHRLGKDELGVYLYSMINGLKLVMSPVLYRGKPVLETGDSYLCNKTYYLGACMRKVKEQMKVNYPEPPNLPLERVLHNRGSDTVLRDSYVYQPIDTFFLDEGLRLAKEHGTKVVFYTEPNPLEHATVVNIQRVERDDKAWDVPIIVTTRHDMLKDKNIDMSVFYQADGAHMLYNATNYYTEITLPALLKIYEQALVGELEVQETTSEGVALLHSPPPGDMSNMDWLGEYFPDTEGPE